jgi:hypothetical protein
LKDEHNENISIIEKENIEKITEMENISEPEK